MSKKFFQWLTHKFSLYFIDEKTIYNKLINYKINKCFEYVTIGVDSHFYEQSEVFNLQYTKELICIGNNTHIRGELLVYASGGEIKIGDYCYIGEHSRIWSGERVEIGNNVLISHNVNIIDTNSHEINYLERADGYEHIITKGHLKNKGSIKTSKIIIEDHVWINFNSIILKGITIGEGAIIAPGSVVTKNVPPFTLVAGNPAEIIKKLAQ